MNIVYGLSCMKALQNDPKNKLHMSWLQIEGVNCVNSFVFWCTILNYGASVVEHGAMNTKIMGFYSEGMH